MNEIEEILKQYTPIILFNKNELMAKHTTFETGGPADFYITPSTIAQTQYILKSLKKITSNFFFIGEGANILVSDKGIRGIVISTTNMRSIKIDSNAGLVIADSGVPISQLAETTVSQGFEGIENFNGMPGSVGGSLYMNARCYEKEIADILVWTDIINSDGDIERIPFTPEEWSYKRSPFQSKRPFILRAAFKIKASTSPDLNERKNQYKNNRTEKGHFKFPCAGSTFKNNRAFGQPTGKIIDSLELKGYSIGDAAVSDFHANIIINRGHATSSDIRLLIEEIQTRVKKKTGFDLEPEVEFVGEWR